jgi:hypothetical protein
MSSVISALVFHGVDDFDEVDLRGFCLLGQGGVFMVRRFD